MSLSIGSIRDRWRAIESEDAAGLLGLGAALPLLVWWIGWFPGFLSSDSIDQLSQADRFDFVNVHPVVHSFTMWLVMQVWDNVGAVTLLQVLLMALVLAYGARRLVQTGAPLWLSVGAVWAISLLPAVGVTTIAVWKDVPFTIALVWAFVEALGIRRATIASSSTIQWGAVRLGLALGLVWVFRQNGFITVLPFVALIVFTQRRHVRYVLSLLGALSLVIVSITIALYSILPIGSRSIEPSTVFISDVAASLTNEPSNFTTQEVEYLETIAPLTTWTGLYDCHDSTPLAFAPSFAGQVIEENPDAFRRLAFRAILRDLDTVLGHRWCAASYLLVPYQPRDAYFQRPPFDIPVNDLGIERRPLVWRAYEVTLAVFKWAEPASRLWLTWRPAIVVWPAFATYLVVVRRRHLRHLLLAGGLILAQMVNVAGTSPAQEFRYAFGIYLMGLLSLPLLWPALSSVVVAPAPGSPADAAAVIPDEVGVGQDEGKRS